MFIGRWVLFFVFVDELDVKNRSKLKLMKFKLVVFSSLFKNVEFIIDFDLKEIVVFKDKEDRGFFKMNGYYEDKKIIDKGEDCFSVRYEWFNFFGKYKKLEVCFLRRLSIVFVWRLDKIV